MGGPDSRAMTPDCGSIRAAYGAVLLAAVAGDVNDYGSARVARGLACCASFQAMHASGGEVQRCSDAEYRGEHVGKRSVLVAIVQVPAFVVVVGQPGIGGRGCHLVVEDARSEAWIARVDHGQPVIDDA